MTDIIELAFEAGAEFIPTTKQDGFESPEYVETVWAFNQDELTKFAQLLQQGEAVGVYEGDVSDVMGCFSYVPNLGQPLKIGQELFTTPPDTQQKLDKAREALTKIASLTQTENLLWWQIEARQALKETE